MSTTDKLKLIAAEVGARLLIYGAIGVPCVMFLGWITVPALVLSASEPYLNMGIAKAGAWLEDPKRPKWIRDVMDKLNPLLDHFAGKSWWKHVGRFLPGFVIGAFMPIPAVLSHSVLGTAIDGLLGTGTLATLWTGVVGGVMFTTLPAATKLLTTGLEHGFKGLAAAAGKLPVLGEPLSKLLTEIADLHVEHVVQKAQASVKSKDARVAERAALRAQLRGVKVSGRNPRSRDLRGNDPRQRVMELTGTVVSPPSRSSLRTVQRVKALAGQFQPQRQARPADRGVGL